LRVFVRAYSLTEPVVAQKEHRVGIVGSGFIADYHARAVKCVPHATVVAVCDLSGYRAKAFAKAHGVPDSYASLDEMLRGQQLDVIHVTTPPDAHSLVAAAALKGGANVFLEKPMCPDVGSCDALLDQAEREGLCIGVNQNTLFYPGYERLREDVRQGVLGRLDHLTVTWRWALPFLRSGPFDLWMLREPGHIALEIGSHALAHVLDLVGKPDDLTVRVSDAIQLPGRRLFYRRWQVLGYSGPTAIDLSLSFGPGFAERQVHLRGSHGAATMDIENNTYILQRGSRFAEDFGRYEGLVGVAHALRKEARRNLKEYLFSKLGMSDKGNAFGYSITQCVRSFYAHLGTAPDERNAGKFGRDVIEQCARIANDVPLRPPSHDVTPAARASSPNKAEVLVIGGTGFIGRELVRQLLASGRSVRLLTRNAGRVSFDGEVRGLEVFEGSLHSDSDVARAIEGTRYVFHLARAAVKTWQDYYNQDVLVTKRIAEECLRQGVERLIYTGTIASYYAGTKAGVITEETPLDPRIDRRDNYARAKAVSEKLLMELHRERKLPVVIFRPGVVIGTGGSTAHWGVGMWTGGGGVCQLWGNGRNKLPFVLVEDVAKAMVTGMFTPGVDGETFNLVADPCLSAVEFLDELQRYAGIKIRVLPTSICRYYAVDMLKWIAKVLIRHPGRRRPLYRDWETRTAKAVFDCSKAKIKLGWSPASERDALVVRGIHCPYDEEYSGTAGAKGLAVGKEVAP